MKKMENNLNKQKREEKIYYLIPYQNSMPKMPLFIPKNSSIKSRQIFGRFIDKNIGDLFQNPPNFPRNFSKTNYSKIKIKSIRPNPKYLKTKASNENKEFSFSKKYVKKSCVPKFYFNEKKKGNFERK